ncbi:MAG: hypothetical protein HeimAB125_21530, partial [Candidatus Heimdallarchaeota archaeon AB_125]
MDDGLKKKIDFLTIENLLAILELLLFLSIVIFYILYFRTHPSAWTCDIQITQTWVSIFAIIYSVICLLPFFIYGFIRRNNIKLINLYPFIRLGIIISFLLAESSHSAGCRAYISPVRYRTVI